MRDRTVLLDQNKQSVKPAGSAEYWWGRPGAAELANPHAQAFRQASCTSLQLRWLMPRLAAQLLGNDAASAQHTDKKGTNSGKVQSSCSGCYM